MHYFKVVYEGIFICIFFIQFCVGVVFGCMVWFLGLSEARRRPARGGAARRASAPAFKKFGLRLLSALAKHTF